MNLVNKTVKGINRLKKQRDEWIKKYEDIVHTYKSTIEEANKKSQEAVAIVKEDKKEHEDLKSQIFELKEVVKEFSNFATKKISDIEKVEKDLINAKKDFLTKFEKQEKMNDSLHESIKILKERVKDIEEKQEKLEKLIGELKISMRDFTKQIINHLNTANNEYEKRFDRFRQAYEDVIKFSKEIKKDMRHVETVENILENFNKKISNIEEKIDKLNNSVLVSEKRIDMLRKEKEIINQRLYDIKEDINYKLKELKDAISMLEEDVVKKH
ncbi:MAG: hypothetical protein N3E38_02110 [Candidatus Aenigmarchaeota archaeon]|nr:hypothetical protein [Candidatus Aenigmarchaeota archaeon]